MTDPGRILLDTSVVIDMGQDMGQVDLGRYADLRAAVSSVTIAELAFGADVPDPVERRARNERYRAALNHFDTLPFDLSAAKLYGVLASLVRQAGRNPRPRRLDLQIAATAAAYDLPLITRNSADFTGLERVVEVIAV